MAVLIIRLNRHHNFNVNKYYYNHATICDLFTYLLERERRSEILNNFLAISGKILISRLKWMLDRLEEVD